MIVRHENHPMGTEATLIYNLWVFSWLINLLRRLMGIIFGFGGRVLYTALETYHGQVGFTGALLCLCRVCLVLCAR